MISSITLILAVVALIEARSFNNPILADKVYEHPGAIKLNGTYYVVSRKLDTSAGVFPIHTSTDLINWQAAGYVFDETNTPEWAMDGSFLYPEIHKIGYNYQVYFFSYDKTGNSTSSSVGVAIAPHPLGPYMSIDRAIYKNNLLQEVSIMNKGEKLYLLWSEGTRINSRQLTSNGLTFSSDQTTILLDPTLTWEDKILAAPWYVHRGDYHYIFYSGGGSFTEDYGVGVARSSNPLGPYEKLLTPILNSNSKFKYTGHVSLIKDLDDENDIIFFEAYRKNDSFEESVISLASVGWDDKDWPYIQDF